MRAAVRPLLAVAALVAALLAWAQPALAAPPAPTGLPSISGTTREGQVLKTTNGTWSGATPLSYGHRWLRCDAEGAACEPIAGATSAGYTATAADVGRRLRVTVTATNIDGEATSTSAASAEIAPKAPPVNTVLPAVTGTAVDGQTLAVDTGTWTGTATISYARRWLRCDASGGACTQLAATGTTYKLTSADVGSTVRVQVTATNADGIGVVTSAATVAVDAAPPLNTVAPSTGGTPREGQTLNVSNVGSWQGTTPIAYTQQWERCAADGTACAPIAGATAKSYVLAAADVGSTVRARVTATNVEASVAASSAVTSAIAPKAPPVNGALPAVTGTAVDAQQLSGSTGTWTGTATITYARRWLRCDASGAACVELAATGTSYTLTSADVGSTVRLRVTATNPDGTGVAVSDPSAVVAPALPTSTVAPGVTGVAREGQLLSASTGTWKGTPTIAFAHQWQRCDTAGACADIAGATAPTYRLAPADVGGTVRAVVRASNAAGDATRASAATATVTPGPPVAVDLPQTTGALARDGETWNGALGTWAGTATIVHDRQWLRCSTTGASCAAISGEVAATYRLSGADVGRTVRLEVTAANSQGTVKVLSPPSPVIAAAPPTADAAPVVAGDLRDTALLTAQSTWSGTAPIALSHTWQRCDVLSGVCQEIPGATAATYRLTGADVGARVRVRVGATNAAGGGVAESATSAVVQPDPPRATAAPVLGGIAVELDVLTVSTGTFSGTAPLTRTVQWQRCDDQGQACADIAGATGFTRTLDGADRGRTLRARVTATNDAGSDSAVSAVSAVVAAAPPRNTVAPAVSPDSGLKDGVTVTATGGGWTGSDPLELSWRWQRCTSTGADCADIPGAGERTYETTTGDVGSRLRVVVTATTPGGQATQASVATGVVGTNPPVNVVVPSLTGTARDGQSLRAETGEWTGLVPMTTTYRWWRCDTAGANCGLVPDATASTYRLTGADVGLTVRGEVQQANAGGATAVRSPASDVVAAAPPRSVVAPRITGGAAVGRTLSADLGVWEGTPELRFAYAWLRCDAAGEGCVPIAGANASTYRPGDADNELALRVRVTANNDVGTVTVESASTAAIENDPPVNVMAPRIEAAGVVADGTRLQVQPGAWAGALPMDMSFQWRRCDAVLSGCVDVTGATESSYRLTKDDVNKRLLVVVTAENVVADASVETAPTPVVLPEPPVNVTAPVITAVADLRDGTKLSAGRGTWGGAIPMTYLVRWLRCDGEGAACAEIPDATNSTYTLGPEDVGRKIRLRVTARNGTADAVAQSASTDVVAAALPVSTARPTVVVIDGKPRLGGKLRAATGSWDGTGPLDFDARWQRCAGTSVTACDDIPGAVGTEYVLGDADVGRRVRVVVTARNVAGEVTADSAPTELVPAIAPESTAPPAIADAPAREGVELTASPGSWSGSGPHAFAYAWERCTAAGAATCPKIAGATRASHTLTSEDVGKYVRVTVTATNAAGKATRSSAATAQVGGLVPRMIEAPSAVIKGDPKVGTTLTTTNGRWTGTVPLKYEVRWQRCNARGLGCADVAGGTKATYTLKASDLEGALLKGPMRAVISATNVAGTAEAPSNIVGTVVAEDVGAAADRPPGVARDAPKAKVAAAVRRVRLTPKGKLIVKVKCPKKARGRCGTIGSIAAGRIAHGVSTNHLAKGKGTTKVLKLTKRGRRWLRGRRKVRFLLRIAAPATPTRPRLRRVTVKVPKKLSGKVRRAKPQTAKQRAAALKRKRLAAAKKKLAAARKEAAEAQKTAEALGA